MSIPASRRMGTDAMIGPLLLILIGSITLLSCQRNPMEGMAIAVVSPIEPPEHCNGASLVAVDPENPGRQPVDLSEEFHSACAPSLSHDGTYLVFQGRKEPGDPWQIWGMELRGRKVSRITDLAEDCTGPACLPDGRILFSRHKTTAGVKVATIHRCQTDGTQLEQLTYHPHLDSRISVLLDGRVLYATSPRYPQKERPVFMVMRPDGTKSEIFYRSPEGMVPAGRGTERNDGYVFFIEREAGGGSGGSLVMLNQNRPLHSRQVLSKNGAGSFLSVDPTGPVQALVCYRPSREEHYALYGFDTEENELTGRIWKADGHVTAAVKVRTLPERPRKLPSAVNHRNPTGLLMSQNINRSMVPAPGNLEVDTAVRIRITHLNGLWEEVDVEADGSFYVKMDADTPFRIRTINPAGEPVRGPSDWIWLRPNERRGCVGCHADPELAPDNRVPLAVKKPPVIVSLEKNEISKLEEER